MFSDIFNCYYEIYEDLLDGFYPAKHSTGFQERNLSVNWVKALERTRQNHRITSWFEYQFGEKNNEHIDALVWDRDTKDLFLIESKRFSNPDSKVESVGADIERLIRMDFYNDIIKYEDGDEIYERINPADVQNIYGIILADVWTEGNRKKEILQEFKEGTFLKNESDLLCAGAKESDQKHGLNPDGGLQEYEFKSLAYYTHNISTIPAYNLLGISWQIE